MFYPKETKFVRLQEDSFIVNNVLNTIARYVSNVRFTSDQENSPILKILENPNDDQTKVEFLKEFTINLLASGYACVWKHQKSFGVIETMQLININPDTVLIDGNKVTFEYQEKEKTVKISDVLFFYDMKRRHNDVTGVSRLTPLRSQIENIKDAQIAKGIQIENSGTTIVSPKASTGGNNMDDGLNAPVPHISGNTKTQKQVMEDTLNGGSLANRIIVASQGLDAVNLSAQLNNVRFDEIVETDILAIYDAYNFPPELSPYGKNAKFDNKELAEVGLVESEVLPLVENIVRTFNSEYPQFKPVEASFSHLNSMSLIGERLVESNERIVNQYNVLLTSGVITAAEFKKIMQEKGIL